LTDFRKPCGRANGLTFDRQGRLVMCQSAGNGGGRRVTRLEADGQETVLAERFAGQPFNAPNDLCCDRLGRIYFTDPNFGEPADAAQPVAGVYRIDAPGEVKLVIRDLKKPNGIVLSPDESLLYVSDRGTQKLHRYQVAADGGLTPDGILYDFAPDRGVDGMRVDERGNVWAAAGQGATTGLFVISPKGERLLHKPMPEFSTNLSFGGSDRRDLFFTASTSVYWLRTRVPGAIPRAKE
jgi:gluconolactonase